jgi:hypothetical protein
MPDTGAVSHVVPARSALCAVGFSGARVLEILPDRFGAFEAIAYATIKLARYVPEDELSMDLLVADAVLLFADDLRAAHVAAAEWLGL